eukprot:Skav223939  [mRNA]  locus=scaffold1465:226335:229127:+ [translate_table: standard]
MASNPEFYRYLLQSSDIHGAIDSQWFPEVMNLMVIPTTYSLTDESLVLTAMQFGPEGLGFHSFDKDALTIPEDVPLQEIKITWDSTHRLPELGQKCFLRKVGEGAKSNDYVFLPCSVCMPVSMQMPVGRAIHLLEMFSGGFGGWKSAVGFLERVLDQIHVDTVATEQSAIMAMSYAISHSANMIKSDRAISHDMFSAGSKWVVCADIQDLQWQEAAAHWQVDVCSVSSPSPPWSGASSAAGLKTEQGRLLIEAILTCRFFRPHFILIEQVHGFASHPDRCIVEKTLHFCGYRILWQKVLNVNTMLKTSRPRWLAVAQRIHSPVVNMSIPRFHMNMPPRSGFTEVMDLSMATRDSMYLSDEVVRIATDKDYLATRGHERSMTAEEILQSRTYDVAATTPIFMAKYGTQHLLPQEYLKTNKYYGHFCKDDLAPHGARHWHPMEVAIKHGLIYPLFLFEDDEMSWLLLGNMITPVHALIPLMMAFNYFIPEEVDFQYVLRRFQEERDSATDVITVNMAHGYVLLNKNCQLTPEQVQKFEQLIHMCVQTPIPDFTWTVAGGLQGADDDLVQANTMPTVSQVTQEDEVMIDSTAQFGVVLKGVMHLHEHVVSFWFAANIPFDHLSSPWNWQFTAQLCEDREIGSPHVELHPCETQVIPDPVTCVIVPTLMDRDITLLSLNQEVAMMLDHTVKSVSMIPHDQFGPIHPSQKPTPDTLVMATPLSMGQLNCHLPILLAAFQQTRCTVRWSAVSDTIMLAIHGEQIAVETVADFFAEVIPGDEVLRMGRQIKSFSQGGSATFFYVPFGDKGVCPPRQFALLVAIAASRLMFEQLRTLTPTDADTPVRVAWLGRPLWNGSLSKDIQVSILETLMQYSLMFCLGLREVHVFNHAARLMPEATIRDARLIQHATHGSIAALDIQPQEPVLRLVGGGPSKNQ